MRRRFILILTIVICFSLIGSVSVMGGGKSEESGKAEKVEPIKIGGAFPMTGPYAYDGKQMEAGCLLAIEEINAGGGLLGRPLELVKFDVEAMMSEKFMAAATKFVLEEKVDMISGGWSAMGPDIIAFGKYDVPYLTDGSVPASKLIRENPDMNWNCFQLGPMEPAYAKQNFYSMIGLPYEFPNNKIVLIAGDYEWDRVYTNVIKELGEKEGFEMVYHEVVPYGTRDWTSILTKIRALDPALIFIEELDARDQATFMAQFLDNPTNSLISVCYMVTIPAMIEMGGDDFTGVTGYTMCTPKPHDAAGEAWKAKFEERFGWVPPGGVPPLINYDGIYVWAEAVKRVGDPSAHEEVCKSIKENPHEGLAGRYTFNNEINTVTVSDTFPGAYSAQIQNGRVVLWEEYEEEEFLFPPWIEKPWPSK